MSTQPDIRYGQLIATTSPSSVVISGREITRQDHLWRPSQLVSQFLPDGFEIPFVCFRCEGERRFAPSEKQGGDTAASTFCNDAAIAGQAIRKAAGKLSPELSATISWMRLLFQLSPRLRERLIRSFNFEMDLSIKGHQRAGLNANILPDDFGCSPDQDRPWSVGRLLKEGLQHAQKNGVPDPTISECIKWGVDYEASIHPLRSDAMAPEEARREVRQILFDLGPSEECIDAALKQRVYGRLIDAMEGHLNDPGADFNRWFFENFDSIVHQISKRKKPDGPIDRLVVRQTFLELVADSWQYLGPLINDFMGTVSDLVDPVLTSHERLAFDTVYRRNPLLGQFPLILFHEYLPFLRPSIQAVLDVPGEQTWGQFRRALQTYATMVSRRREADKVRKRTRTIKIQSFIATEHDVATSRNMQADLQGIVRKLLELRQTRCDCETDPRWESSLTDKIHGAVNLPVHVRVRCVRCHYEFETELTLDELRHASDELA